MKKILIFGSIFAVVILILASFPSVVSVQVAKTNSEKFDVFIDKFISRIQKDDRFKEVDVNELKGTLQNLINNNAADGWYPGMILELLFTIIYNYILVIVRGEWFPGFFVYQIVVFTIIFLFWLAWFWWDFDLD